MAEIWSEARILKFKASVISKHQRELGVPTSAEIMGLSKTDGIEITMLLELFDIASAVR